MICFRNILQDNIETISCIDNLCLSKYRFDFESHKIEFNRVFKDDLENIVHLIHSQLKHILHSSTNSSDILVKFFENTISFANIVRIKNEINAQNFNDWCQITILDNFSTCCNDLHAHILLWISFLNLISHKSDSSSYLFMTVLAVSLRFNWISTCECLYTLIENAKSIIPLNQLYVYFFDIPIDLDTLFPLNGCDILKTIQIIEKHNSYKNFDWNLIPKCIQISQNELIDLGSFFLTLSLLCDSGTPSFDVFNAIKSLIEPYINVGPKNKKYFDIYNCIYPTKLIVRGSTVLQNIKNNILEDISYFEMFVSIFSLNVKRLHPNEIMKLPNWMSKMFHFDQLNPNIYELYHMCLIYISVAMNVESVSEMICKELIGNLEKLATVNKMSSDHLHCIICAYFSIYIIFSMKKFDSLKEVSLHLKESFSTAIKRYLGPKLSLGKIESPQKYAIDAFLDAFNDAFDHVLKDSHFFNDMFNICLPIIFSPDNTAFEQRCCTILKKATDFYKNHPHDKLSVQTCTSILSRVKRLLSSHNESAFYSEFSGIVVSCLIVISPDIHKLTDWICSTLFSKPTNYTFVLNFWSRFLMVPRLREFITTSPINTLLIQFWVDSYWEMPPESHNQLTTSLLNLELFRSLYKKTDPLNPLCNFIDGIAQMIPEIPVNEKLEFHKQINSYFKNFSSSLHKMLTDCNFDKSKIYNVCSKLMVTLPTIIYTKSFPDCVLPFIVDNLILPTNKLITNNINVENYLHLFLSGLAHLDVDTDEYIRRKLTHIFNRYFTSCLDKYRDNINNNPFIVSISITCEHSFEDNQLKFRILLFDLINMYVADKITQSPLLLSCLEFIEYVTLKTTQESVNKQCCKHALFIVSTSLLSTFLQPSSLDNIMLTRVKTILDFMEPLFEDNPEKTKESTKNFFNLYFNRYTDAVLSTIEWIVTKYSFYTWVTIYIKEYCPVKNPLFSKIKLHSIYNLL